MEKKKKWIKNYIEDIDLEKIEWIKLDCNQLNAFIEENYLDKDNWEYVTDNEGIYPTLLGMSYLNIYNPFNDKKYSFLLGVANNNINKKTVICATIYLDEYFIFTDQDRPVTYISTIEVNSYFRNKGIYKKMCEQLINFINPNQHIVTTKQSEMGAKYNLVKIFKEILELKNFQNYIVKSR